MITSSEGKIDLDGLQYDKSVLMASIIDRVKFNIMRTLFGRVTVLSIFNLSDTD